ncbi:flagellin, partial [Clostridium paraputrificum]
IQEEINALTQEIDRISEQTEFNKQTLLNGTFNGTFQIGANGGQTINLKIDNMASGDLGLTSTTSKTEVVADTGAAGTGAAIKAGTYTVKGTDIVDEEGKKVGTVAAKVATFGDKTNNTTITVTGDALKDGDKITFDKDVAAKNGATNGVNAKVETKTDLTDAGKVLAAGTYEIKGDLVLRDGKQVGSFAGGNITINGKVVNAGALGRTTALANNDIFTINGTDVSSSDKASGSIETINKAIENVSTQRAKLGAVQNRLEHTTANLNNTSENLTAAESRVRDVDMAKEMMTFSKNNILSQAAQAMLAQANQQPQGVLQLLR